MLKKLSLKTYVTPEVKDFGPYHRMALCANSFTLQSVEEDDTTITWLDE